jgi:hypothetical protein
MARGWHRNPPYLAMSLVSHFFADVALAKTLPSVAVLAKNARSALMRSPPPSLQRNNKRLWPGSMLNLLKVRQLIFFTQTCHVCLVNYN